MMTKEGTIEGITDAIFPQDIPSDSEEKFIAIVCEPDYIHWCLHEGVKHKFAPSVFWRTPHIQDEDRSPTPCLTLHRFLSKHAMTLIFGGGEMKDATKQSASRAAAKRKVPSVSIYVLSNSRDHERDLVQLFRDVPSRLIRLRPSNFFTSKQLGGLSESMLSVGQYAAMYAAKKDHGSPILLLTGGNAITYVGIDKDSKFLGGGACPGMSIRCRSLFDFCTKDFPSVDFHEYKKITDKARLDKKPISLFATNMQVGIAANATAELAGHLRNIIKQFLKLVGPADTPATVVVTGEDLEILGQLLKEDCSGLIETEPDVAYPSSDKIAFTLRKNLTHYGVEHLLLANQKKRPIPNPDEETRDRFIGLRVATFKKPSKTTFRGSISRIVPGKKLEEDTFVVLLDDGETVYLDFLQIYDALSVYREVGEETTGETTEDWVGEKLAASAEVQVNMEGTNDMIQKRKLELDAAKEKEGSIISAVRPEEKEARPKKRPKRSSKKKESDPRKFIGQRIAKYFDDPIPNDPGHQIIYFGTIDKYTPGEKLWHITYDDDDEEEFDFPEIREAILLYSKNKDDDKNAIY